jgi:hypothetical protein
VRYQLRYIRIALSERRRLCHKLAQQMQKQGVDFSTPCFIPIYQAFTSSS